MAEVETVDDEVERRNGEDWMTTDGNGRRWVLQPNATPNWMRDGD